MSMWITRTYQYPPRHNKSINLAVPMTYGGSLYSQQCISLIARFMGPTWGPPGADRTEVGPMLAPWTFYLGCLETDTHIRSVGYFNIETFFARYEDFHYKIKRPWDRTHFMKEIYMLIREHLFIKTAAYIQCSVSYRQSLKHGPMKYMIGIANGLPPILCRTFIKIIHGIS